MTPKLQAGIELTFEKMAAEEAGEGMLTQTRRDKLAATQDQGVEQTAASGAGSPSSASSKGMEDKNDGYGKGTDDKLEDDPTKGKSAEGTGEVQNSMAGKNVTVEGSGMPDLSMKNASQLSPNARVLHTMIQGALSI